MFSINENGYRKRVIEIATSLNCLKTKIEKWDVGDKNTIVL